MDRRKKLLLFGVAWLSALGLTWFLYANAVAPKVEPQVRVVVAAHDMPLGTLVRQSDIRLVNYPERNVPKGAVFQAANAVNRVLLVAMNTGEPVLNSRLSAPTSVEGVSSTIETGYRAVAVQITDASGVAGLIQAGSRVDVLFTRPGSMAEATTATILQNVKVLSTGRPIPAGQAVDPRTPKAPVVTLVLAPEDAQKLELAKNEGKISLSLRNPLDASRSPSTGPVTTEVLDPMIGTRLARARIPRAAQEPAPQNQKKAEDAQKEKERLEDEARRKREAEKPRVVVDVYRGEKHVQEQFR